MFPTSSQMECAFQDQYFTPCMYEDFERENINLSHCHENSLNLNDGHYQQLESKSLFKNTANNNNNNNSIGNHKKMESAHIFENMTTIDDDECTTTVQGNVQCVNSGVLSTSTNVYKKAGQLNGARNKQRKLKNSGKSCYKHVPHKDKPPHLVERRNARERRRVQAVNSAFARLRKSVPLENRSKRVSKVKTLQKAIEYINYLQDVLRDDSTMQMATNNYQSKRDNGSGPSGGAARWL
ncbi:hypothetical protein CHUAL_010912 [Chamberlinius hualienensis]